MLLCIVIHLSFGSKHFLSVLAGKTLVLVEKNLRPGLAMMIATLRHPRSSSLPLDNSLSQPFSSHSISDVAKGVTLSPQHHGNTLQPCTLGPQGPGKVEECGEHSGCAT